MTRQGRLVYEGKSAEDEILGDTTGREMRKVRSFGAGESPWGDWDNIFVYGDNLAALRALLGNLGGKVRLVYIDPPFSARGRFRGGGSRVSTVSSGKDDPVAYADELTGTEYLEFLRHRLVLLRELLTEDGSIYVHIDSRMGHYVKVLMDEIFGHDKFVNEISRIKCKPKNFARPAYGNIKDTILFYSKSRDRVWNEPTVEIEEEDLERLYPKVDDEGRRYTTTPLHAPGETRDGPTGQPWRDLRPPKGRHWRYPPEELERLDAEGLIEWSSTGNPRKIIYADEARARGKKLQDIWDFRDPQYPTYPTEKNLEMLEIIVHASSNPGDIVLDCFAGSGTTLVAAEALGRRWVGIDNSPASAKAALERLNALEKCSGFTLYSVGGDLEQLG